MSFFDKILFFFSIRSTCKEYVKNTVQPGWPRPPMCSFYTGSSALGLNPQHLCIYERLFIHNWYPSAMAAERDLPLYLHFLESISFFISWNFSLFPCPIIVSYKLIFIPRGPCVTRSGGNQAFIKAEKFCHCNLDWTPSCFALTAMINT